jgi:diguanylate cyclase (GGDEF)-like protein
VQPLSIQSGLSLNNELFTADLEVRLRSAEANFLLRRYRAERGNGNPATVAMLDREIMRIYGPHLALLEKAEDGEFRFLYAGATVPNGEAGSLNTKDTGTIDSATAELYRLGCTEATKAEDAICINHQTGINAAVHRWECLFLPMEDGTSQRMFVALCVPREPKHEFLRILIDSLPNGVIAASPIRDSHNEIIDATIIAANARAVEYSEHLSLDGLLATTLCHAFGDSTVSSGWDRHLTVLRSGKPQTFDYHHRSEKGSRWLQVHSAPIRDGVLISLTDITDMKRAFLELEHQKKVLMDEMEQRRGLEQELWALAHLDPLTGLPNRRAFRDAAMLKLAEAQTAHRPCAIITIDIDHFKHVNDAFGHGAGDTVLRRVADIIKAPLRPNTDIGARMGGEEFTVLLPDTDAEAAVAFAEKLRRRVEQTVVVVGEQEIRPAISLGVAMNRKSTDLDDLIDRADRALYVAKRTGRNKVATEMDVQSGNTGAKPAGGQAAA